jgi:polyhydroxybutyrate depolymerase
MKHVSLGLGMICTALAGCGSDDDSSGSGGSSGSGDVRPSNGCESATPVPPGDSAGALTWDGVERTYQLHVPPENDPALPSVLVVNMHGLTPIVGSQAAQTQANLSKMIAKSDAANFIVVHPQGLLETNGTAAWNADGCCAGDKARDDVGFIRAMLDNLSQTLCIDERRIYVSGMSNGGMMSHRIGCELSDRVAAIAPVAGAQTFPSCEPRSISVIAFHGTSDRIVSFESGKSAVTNWIDRNGCTGEPVETFRNGDSHCETYSGCRDGAEVVFCIVDDGGHTWPGGTPIDGSAVGFDTGKTTMDLSANDAMWEFFGRHRLP